MDFVTSHFGKMDLWPVDYFFQHICHHFWVGLLLHLVKGSSFWNDVLQMPYINEKPIRSKNKSLKENKNSHKSFYISNCIELHQTYFIEKPYSEHVVASMSCLHFMVTNFTFCRIMTMKEGLPCTHVWKIDLDPLWCPKEIYTSH